MSDLAGKAETVAAILKGRSTGSGRWMARCPADDDSGQLSQGKIPGVKVGARTMVKESDLEAFVARCNPKAETAR